MLLQDVQAFKWVEPISTRYYLEYVVPGLEIEWEWTVLLQAATQPRTSSGLLMASRCNTHTKTKTMKMKKDKYYQKDKNDFFAVKTVPFISSGVHCTLHCNSFPPQADPHTLRHYPLIQHENGLQTAILGLDFQVLVIVHVIVLIVSWSM